MTEYQDVTKKRNSIIRTRGNIFGSNAGFMSKLEKNAASGIVRIVDYDAPTSLFEDIDPAHKDIIKVAADIDDNLYFIGDTLAIREEDGTAEPLGSTKEEFRVITDITDISDGLQITLASALVNTYSLANAVIYNTITSEKYLSGYDKVVTIIELWKNN